MLGSGEGTDQATFAELKHDGKKRTTRRERILHKMDGLIPWEAIERRIGMPRMRFWRPPGAETTVAGLHTTQLDTYSDLT